MKILALALLACGCAATGPSVRRPDATLQVICPVADARVYLDDVFAGTARELGERGARVVSGVVRVEVRADGWFTAYREATVTSGARARIEIPLRPVPDGEPGG
jgi:hypothetical protein